MGLERGHRLLRLAGDVRLRTGVTRRYRFAHVLYHETLCNSLEPARRRGLCLLLAQAIVAMNGEGDPTMIGNVARLLHEAGAGEAALGYFARAAEHAIHLSAYRQALEIATQAAGIARECAPGESVRRFEIGFLTTQAVSLTSLEGFGAVEIERIYLRAREVARELGDPTAATSIAHLHWSVVSIINLEASRELADVLLKDADAARNPEAGALARMAQGLALLHMGVLPEAAAVLADATEQWRGLEGALGFRSYMLDPAVATQCNLARALWFVGKPGEAWRTALDTVELASRIGHHRTTAYALALAANVAHLRRDVAATMEWSEKAIEVAREHEFMYEAAWARILQAWVLAQTGDAAQAIGIFQAACQYRGPGATKALCHYAEALGKRHRFEEAFAVLNDALRLAAQRGERYYVSELERMTGELALRSDGPAGRERAGRLFAQAVASARACGAASCELRAASSLARFALEFRPELAHDALAGLEGVARGFGAGDVTPDLHEARELLAAFHGAK